MDESTLYVCSISMYNLVTLLIFNLNTVDKHSPSSGPENTLQTSVSSYERSELLLLIDRSGAADPSPKSIDLSLQVGTMSFVE